MFTSPPPAASTWLWTTRLGTASDGAGLRDRCGQWRALSGSLVPRGKNRRSADAKPPMTANDHHVAGLALAAQSTGETARPVDCAGVQRAASDLLRALGADLESEALRETLAGSPMPTSSC